MRLTRRTFLIGGGLVGGGLVVGVAGATGALALRNPLGIQRAALDGHLLALWLLVHPEGHVELLSPHTEMGQGANTGLVQIVADELDLRWDQVHLGQSPVSPDFANGEVMTGFVQQLLFEGAELSAPTGHMLGRTVHLFAQLRNLQVTGGSASIRFTGWRSMRHGAAIARHQLVAAAAARWGVDASTLRTEEGEVVAASGERLGYGELAADAAALSMPSDVSPKPRHQWRFIGKPLPRHDLPDKIFGRPVYAIDHEVNGMAYAAVRNVRVLGATVNAVRNEAEVRARRGIASVHVIRDGVAVLADNPWRAEQAVRALDTDETAPEPAASATTASLLAEQRAALEAGEFTDVDRHGDSATLLAAGDAVEAEYEVPYLAHATLEPMNATVWEQDGRVHVASGVQNPLAARAQCADTLGVALDDVVFHPHTMGGGFGRRGGGLRPGDMNYLEQAMELWAQARVPFKLTWSREQDMRAGRYRNLTVGQYRGALGDDGLPLAWEGRSYGRLTLNSEALPMYGVPNRYTGVIDARQVVPYAAWRSVDASIFGFFLESFVDELAHAAGQDPVSYRIALLDNDRPRPFDAADAKRMARVVREVADFAGWRAGVDSQGRAMGVAAVKSFGSYVAQIAQVSLQDGVPRVHDVWAAIDCGVAVNPDSVEAQVQGGIIFGLTAARYGRIDIEGGSVVQSNLHDYRLVRLEDAPRLHVRILDSDEAPGGAGEVGVPPIAPAVANALAALGDRRRTLPLG